MAKPTQGVKSTKLGGKVWLCAIIFGLIGQIAWSVENMYFATFAQNIFAGVSNKTGTIVSTLMIWLSEITATVTTIFAGGLIDKKGKRKPFIAFGYIAWGVTIMLFAAIPVTPTTKTIGLIGALLVIFDCVMTFFGSTANDAAFNTWVTDVTDNTNRGKVNGVMSIFSIVAFVLVFVIAMFTYDVGNTVLFFIILGILPIVAGIIAIFILKDKDGILPNSNPNYLKETFYGFRPSVIKDNKMLYVTLTASCLLGIAQQTFFSYLINFIQNTLGIKDYIIPLAVIIVLSGGITAVISILHDKFGRKHFFIPIVIVAAVCMLVFYLMQFMPKNTYVAVMIVSGTLMMGALLSGGGALMSTFQDYIPKGGEGRFQGVRMCFTVLVPFLIGALVSMCINLAKIGDNEVAYMPPFDIFLAATVFAILALVPVIFVVKDADRLRKQKLESALAEKEALESATKDAVETTEMTEVCNCGEDGCNCPFDCDNTQENDVEIAETPVERTEIEE